ncbi:MAG: hypothetical protein AAGB29_09895 [Planctomycetota bacterium]
MRLWIDTLTALLLTGVLAIVLTSGSQRSEHVDKVEDTAAAVDRLQAVTRYQAIMREAADALEGIEPNRLPEMPRHIHPAWFGDNKPVNRLIDAPDRPWVDIAPVGDTAEHPPDPVLIHDAQAGFWFNPTTGVVRARVPMQATDAETLALYRDANAADLAELPLAIDPDRKPLAMVLPEELEVTRASPPPAELVPDALPGE